MLPSRLSARADGRLLIVGLAPGLRGANRTGRPFTGDYAGDLLYATLLKYGFATGAYRADPADGLTLVDAAIANAVRCVPPREQADARGDPHLPGLSRQRRSPRGRGCARSLALGRIAHESAVRALGLRLAAAPFAHGAVHELGSLRLYDSYHCSRYNTNTGVLTAEMFEAVFARIRADLDAA